MLAQPEIIVPESEKTWKQIVADLYDRKGRTICSLSIDTTIYQTERLTSESVIEDIDFRQWAPNLVKDFQKNCKEVAIESWDCLNQSVHL